MKLRRVFQKQILDSIPTAIGRFHLHFTPDYSRILFDYGKEENPEEYKFFNKPLGLRHWMENRLGYTQDGSNPNDMNDTIIIILDPDQIILRPFTTNDFTSDTSAKWRGGGESWFLGKQKGLKVRKGLPFGQMYAYYAEWWDDVRGSISKIIEAINWKDEEYKTKNGLLTLTKDDINRYYIAGPPYLGVASDMYDIVSVWANVTIPVYYASKKDFLAEMFAYSVAAAYLRLPHQLASSFMASDPTAQPATEGWNDPPDHSPDANDNKDFLDWSNPSYDSQNLQLPNVFHYCQEYALGPYYFFKYFIPAGIMNCTHPLLLEPPSLLLQDGKGKLESTNESRANCGSIAFQYNSSISVHTDEALNYTDQLTIKRNAFSLCQMLYKLNDALDFWKQKNCAKGDNPNFARTYVFPVNKGAAILPSIPH